MNIVINSHARRERKKEETRTRLLSTALELMTEKEFDAPTVEAIADAADVGKGTIYNYFKTKEDTVVALFVDLERRVQDKVTKLSAGPQSLEQVLVLFVRHQFRLKRPYVQFVRIFFTQLFARPEHMYPYVVELQAIIDPPLIRLFESLQKRQILRRDVPMERWALEGPPWRNTSRMLAKQISLFCSGLEAK